MTGPARGVGGGVLGARRQREVDMLVDRLAASAPGGEGGDDGLVGGGKRPRRGEVSALVAAAAAAGGGLPVAAPLSSLTGSVGGNAGAQVDAVAGEGAAGDGRGVEAGWADTLEQLRQLVTGGDGAPAEHDSVGDDGRCTDGESDGEGSLLEETDIEEEACGRLGL